MSEGFERYVPDLKEIVAFKTTDIDDFMAGAAALIAAKAGAENAAAAAKLELARELLAPPATGRAATLPAAPAPAASPGKP